MNKISTLALIAMLGLAAPAFAQTPADTRQGVNPGNHGTGEGIRKDKGMGEEMKGHGHDGKGGSHDRAGRRGRQGHGRKGDQHNRDGRGGRPNHDGKRGRDEGRS